MSSVPSIESNEETPLAELLGEGGIVMAYMPESWAWCDWIHDTLHGAKIPRPFVGQRTRYGFPRPDRVMIFPDPRDPNQTARFDKALQIARYLVVVCNPYSSGSDWLKERIRTFKKEGCEERIVVLLVDRDPGSASRLEDADTTENWLPPWLHWRLGEGDEIQAAPHEPVVVDGRIGHLSLEEVRIHLLSALLDLSHADASTIRLPASPAVPVVMEDFSKAASEPATEPARGRNPVGIIAAVIAVLALIGAGWFFLGPGKQQQAADAVKAPVEARNFPSPQQPKAAEPEPEPAAPGSEVAANRVPEPPKTSPNTSIALPEAVPPSHPEPAPDPAAIHPASGISISEPSTRIVPLDRAPETSSDEVPGARPVTRILPATKVVTWQRNRDAAEQFLKNGDTQHALETFKEAVKGATTAAENSPYNIALILDAAALCRGVGELQAKNGAPKEAKETLDHGLRVLARARPSEDQAPAIEQATSELTTVLAGVEGE